MNTSIYDHPDEGRYFGLVYRQGATFLEEAYQTMGAAPFRNALQRYYSAFRGRVATPTAFLDLLQAYSGADLYPLIDAYFSYPRYRSDPPLGLSVGVFPLSDGRLALGLSASAPIAHLTVYVDDHLTWQGTPTGLVVVEGPVDGNHLLTVVAEAGRERRSDWVTTLALPALYWPPRPQHVAVPLSGLTTHSRLATDQVPRRTLTPAPRRRLSYRLAYSPRIRYND